MKLHLVATQSKELVSFDISKGNKHDIKFLESLTNGLTGRIAGDKVYLSKEKKASLLARGLRLITKRRRNMEPQSL